MKAFSSEGRDSGPVLQARSLSKSYPALVSGGAPLDLFRNLELEINSGELIAIVGRSGSGKSSLLHLLAGLDRPTSGEISIGGTALQPLGADQLARFRNQHVGFVWQFHFLLPEFTAEENVAMPLLAAGVPARQALLRARSWLERVALGDRRLNRAGELSGGEQQRVAIARALIAEPVVLLADEPTGDLDTETASQLFELIQQLCRDHGLALVLVTHSLELAARCDRVFRLVEGNLQPILPGRTESL